MTAMASYLLFLDELLHPLALSVALGLLLLLLALVGLSLFLLLPLKKI